MRTKNNYGSMDYSKLWIMLEKKGLNKQRLLENGFNKNAIYKLVNNETVTTETICKLCYYLKCKPGNILDYIPPTEDTQTTGRV